MTKTKGMKCFRADGKFICLHAQYIIKVKMHIIQKENRSSQLKSHVCLGEDRTSWQQTVKDIVALSQHDQVKPLDWQQYEHKCLSASKKPLSTHILYGTTWPSINRRIEIRTQIGGRGLDSDPNHIGSADSLEENSIQNQSVLPKALKKHTHTKNLDRIDPI